MNEKIKLLLTGGTIGTVSGLAGMILGINLATESNKQSISIPPKVPEFSHYDQSNIYFSDNLAPRMTAYAQYNGNVVPLQATYHSQNIAIFKITDELREQKDFVVYSIDMDGNTSLAKSFITGRWHIG